jgi:pimeloyl-ACP methyl ester carboxylesterase
MDYYKDPNAQFFDWSGANSDSARQEAAAELAIQIRRYRRDHPCEAIRVVAHSHGGNVALLASNFRGVNIDELVTLGTPILNDYRPSSSIGIWNNVSSLDDDVQLRAFPYSSANLVSKEATNNIIIRGVGHIQLHTVAAWDAAFPRY